MSLDGQSVLNHGVMDNICLPMINAEREVM